MWVSNLAAFPLTLTLSLGETGQQLGGFGYLDGSPANPAPGLAVRRDTILSLPKGEGRGEGEGRSEHTVAQMLNCARLTFVRAFVCSVCSVVQPGNFAFGVLLWPA